MLAPAVAGIAGVTVVAKLEPVTAVMKSMFGEDVVGGKGNIGRVGWQKVKVGVRRKRRKCQRYAKWPLGVKRTQCGFFCRRGM